MFLYPLLVLPCCSRDLFSMGSERSSQLCSGESRKKLPRLCHHAGFEREKELYSSLNAVFMFPSISSVDVSHILTQFISSHKINLVILLFTDNDIHIIFISRQDDMSDSLRDYTNLPEAAPLLTILDMSARAKYVKDVEEITPAVVEQFVNDFLAEKLKPEPI